MTPDDKTMLALAALTYRGFGNNSEKAIEQALLPWLPKLAAEGLGKWDLVWGPASFRVPTSLVDDAMVYVVREDRTDGRSRYAIAIRGTNPVSVFDWVFGDFWVALQIPWETSSATDAALSASSTLGLEIIRNLAATSPASERGGLAAVADTVTQALQRLSRDLPELLPGNLLKKPNELRDDLLISRIETLTHKETLRASAIAGLLRGLHLQSVERTVFDALVGHIRDTKDEGDKLLTFLDKAVPSGATVAVTGHSKGGALATAAALWLDESWAARKNVAIQCFSFAGPTAGNTGFVNRYNARLGNRTRRVVNALDVVPQGWAPERLRTLRTIYPKLKPALDVVIEAVSDLNYAHVGGEVVEIDSKPAASSLAAEIIHQHLDAYLKAARFQSSDWTALEVFTGA